MKISGVNYESYVDGEGVRAVIFISGCSKNCTGCHNGSAQNKENGRTLDAGLYKFIVAEISKRPFLSGITLSGGDPFESYNIDETSKLIHDLKCDFPKLNIWVYTGELYEDICKKYYFGICNIDVLIDGKFFLEKKDKTLKFKGSTNQRVIDVQQSLLKGEIVLYE